MTANGGLWQLADIGGAGQNPTTPTFMSTRPKAEKNETVAAPGVIRQGRHVAVSLGLAKV